MTRMIDAWRRLSWGALSLALAASAQAAEVVDMVGRRVQAPDHIERVFGAAPPLNVLLHSLAPDKMIGLSFPIPAEGQRYFPPRLRGLPVVGGIFGMGQQMNPEAVLAMQPDIALAWKSPFIDQARIEAAFAKIGLPVVFIQLDTLADWPAALRYTGRLLGQPARGETLARLVEAPLAKVAQVTARIPLEQRPRVYYAEGPDGLATDCHQSFHTEAIELAGGYNVYRCQPKDHTGMEKVSLEQVLAFAPDIIIAQDAQFARAVAQDPRWRQVKAVRAGRVYSVPRWPHNWIDRPPSLMRVLGVQWLAGLFYPKQLPFDRLAHTRAFYQQVLGVSLTEQDIDRLFQ